MRLQRVHKTSQTSNFGEICLVVLELLHAESRAEGSKARQEIYKHGEVIGYIVLIFVAIAPTRAYTILSEACNVIT